MPYNLSVQSVIVLRSILAVPGAARSLEDAYRAGNLLVNVLKVSKMPAVYEEMQAPMAVEINPEERTLIKQAIGNALERGLLSASEWLNELFAKLELISLPKAP